MKFWSRSGDAAQASPSNPIRYGMGMLVILAFLVAIFLLRPSIASAARRLTASNPVTAAWEKAKAAGSYHLTSDIVQKIIPVANIINVGRTSRTDAFHLEGQNDLRQQKLELTLWNQGGSILDPASGVSLRSEAGKTFTRRGNEAWQETDNQMDAFAPQGDFLGYLAAVRNVNAGVQETRNGINFTRYTFDLDGRTFAGYMHEQMLAALRAKGELPAGVQLDPPAYYRDMTGSGELWVGANGLPLRQILNLRFPEQQDERVEANITVDFTKYGAEQTGLLTLLRTGQWQGAWLVLPGRLPDLTGVWLGLTLSATALFVVRYRRARAVQTAIVTAVIVSQIVGPLLSTITQTRFFDSYRAKAAAQEEQQAAAQTQRDLQTKISTAPEFNPHANPLAAGRQDDKMTGGQDDKMTGEQDDWQIATQSPNLSVSPSPSLQATDPGTDTDLDGLTDFTEVRIGTSEVISDTDDDGLSDKLEVDGFTMGGQTWYTNPDAVDSNNDGQSDIVEWGINGTTALPQATPSDTDGDGMPDLFDPDNDNDGVPDRVDSAPLTKGAATYTEANPLQLTVNNLVLDKPTFVDFQIRPQDPKNLWFAYNVLDWPQDTDGQVHDVDNKTYADVAATQGRIPDASDGNGDMKLAPMLEIRIPTASANLPSQAELTPFNISVNDFTADGATKVAYVPLSIVTEPLTGERVAFNGQMRYKPTGSWTVPHSVRLAWVVQALNDLPCDPTAADAAAQGCQSDGYIHNYPSVLHSYYDNWTLTGLNVREENGTSLAILYEDPAVDDNKQDEAPLWALTTALDEHFLKPHDANNDSARDLKLSDFPARFDRDNNPADAQRFGIPNILQVVTNNYTTGDEAAIATAMTETVKILDTAFKPSVQADNNIKPLLLFVEEHNLRAVGLDQTVAGEGYATQGGANVSFNLAPSSASALPVTVQANLKWMAYCGADGNNVTWRSCTSDEYTSVIEARYAAVPSLPDDTDPAEVPGRMMVALAYYSALLGGYSAQVQEGTIIASSRYSLEGESETANRIRTALHAITPLPQIVFVGLVHVFVAGKTADRSATTVAQLIKGTVKQLGVTYYELKRRQAQTDNFIDNALGANGKEVELTKAQIRAVKLKFTDKLPILFARYAGGAVAGSTLSLLLNVLSQVPAVPTPARATLGAIGAAVTAGVSIFIPAATAADFYKYNLNSWKGGELKAKPSLARTLNAVNLKTINMRIAFAVGLVLNILAIWGFYAYAAGTSGLAAGSVELNKAAAEAVASTVIAVLLAVISVTFIGTIIVGIITVIDLIFNLACELGVSSLRLQGNFYGGACFSITTTATKVLAYFLYNSEPMIDTGRNNLMVAGAPDVTLADPNKGFVASNTLTINLPVTTTIAHKDPDPSSGLYINGYLWLYSPDNLRSSTFKYGLSQSGSAPQTVDLNQMTSAWQNVTEDHKYVLTPMYSGVASTNPTPLGGFPLRQGINSSVPFSLTMSYAVPAYECWPMWIPGTFIVFPVCRTRAHNSTNTMPFTVLKYDVFPNTLADFVALGPKADGGQGQRWDARIGSLRDVDGDGLNATLFQGLDPDDTKWDADGDGLSDRFELEQRATGDAYSALLRDTDNDGLNDKQESEIGTNPAVADTDNDGLSDGVEVRRQVYDATGKLTNTWAGGWQVTINSTPARTIWVSSDPFNADGDQDGVSDQAEKELAANTNPTLRVDNQGVPYHPNIANVSPLIVLAESSALFGYVAPNQSFRYTSTVVANVPMAPGMLNVSAPAVLGGAPNPVTLGFNPMSSSNSQTMTVVSNFTVAANTPAQSLALTSTATTRLPDTSDVQWAWTPATTETALGSGGRSSAYINGTAMQPDRQDSYNLIGQAVDAPGTLNSPGIVVTYDLRNGTSRNLEVNGSSWRHDTSPAISCNNLGACLVVWSEKPGGASGPPPQISAALLDPNGSTRNVFTVSAPIDPSDGDSTPIVASDGSNFLVAWQRIDGYSRQLTPTTSTIAFRTELMTRLYDRLGNPLTGEITLTGDRLEFYSANINTTSALNAARTTLNRIDLDWVGDRYRLTRNINVGNAANDPDLRFEDNGVSGNPYLLTWRDINASGALMAGSKATVYNTASNEADASFSLVYNPSTNEVLLVQTRFYPGLGSQILYQQFSSPAVTSASASVIANNGSNAVATYYAPLQGYLIGWTDTSTAARPFRYQGRDRFFQVVGSDQQLTWPSAIDAAAGMVLACPAPQSVPTVELRFEDLFAFNSFQNAVDIFNPASCSAGSCPAAGFPGAPNAPRSDYAVQFDGTNDNLVLNTSAPSSFSVALWVKAAPGATSMLVDQGFNQATGWGLILTGGQPALQIGTGQLLNSARNVGDGAWHFVVATRNGITGDMAIYVDGALANSRPAPTTLLNAAALIYVGRTSSGTVPFQGQMDQLQLYRTVLSASTVQGLYNRTLQSYCVAAAVPTTGTNFPWSRFSLAEQDTRGGRITASGGLRVQVDPAKPTASITSVSNNAVIGADQVIGGSASDVGVGVALVEISVNGGAWQTANGANTWSFSLAGLSGTASLRVRAVDAVGNVGDPSAAINVTIDNTPPVVTITPPTGTLKPTKNAAGQWQVPLSGTATDANGVKAGSILVKLTQTSGVGLAQTTQVASGSWNINYLLDPGLFDPTGSYTVTVQADDKVGNRTIATPRLVQLDAAGPVANLSANDTARTAITQTITIGGVVSDTVASLIGIDKLEIAFTPVDQIAALPGNLTSTEADALLNRTWTPVTLAQRGAGVAQTTWSFAIPTGSENIYQIDLRGTDLLGNVSISANLWRGMIDTRDPRVVMTATATGATYTDTADNTQRYAVQFVCAVQDRNLDESSFVCPGQGLAEPVRTFDSVPALQTLFPDLTLRTGLAISYTLWTTTTTPVATARACDGFGRCATASTASTGSAAVVAVAAAAEPVEAAAAPGAPLAVLVNPTVGSFVAASTGVSVTVAAEAGALLKEVTIKLDNVVVQTLNFAQGENATRILRTIHVPVANEGAHTLVAQATAWDNATQTTLFPVTFTLDQNAPTVTLDASALTMADTWQAQSGILRFNGTASDSVGLAAVQIREGDNDFTDATFGNGTWRVALPVPDPEGRTLTITVRAIDRAGRISATTQAITTNLSAADAPDTTISSGPANPSNDNTASFVFAGSASAVAFDCQLDDGVYTPCASPTVYHNLSKGSHTFRVRAIDSRGLADLSAAEFTWTVNPSALDVTLNTTPSHPTTSRSAAFAFTGNGSSLECSLDGAAFSACSSPQHYSGLANGEHIFHVRTRSGDTVGAAARFVWTVNNAAPVTSDQSVTTNQDTAVVITLVANDEDALTYKVDTPAHGVLLGIPPALTYSPNTGYSGPDSFTFTAHDGLVESNVATVNITVQTVEAPTPTPTATPVVPVETSTPTPTATPVVPTATSTATPTNTPVLPTTTPTATPVAPTATPTTTPVAPTVTPTATRATPTATPTPSGTLIGTCGVYTVYKNGNTYTAAGWTGTIKVGTNSANTLTGGSGRDLMLGLGGNDKLDGKGGDDVLCGGDGVDQVLGVAGNDYLDGGSGNDVLNGGTGDYDELLAGDGNDTLLDGDGVRSAQGGLGNDLFTLAVRNGWRDGNGQPRFTGVAAGYGNDTVALAILNLTRFFVDITGDERDNPPSPLEGTTDSLALAGVIDPASTIIKFERRLVLSADAEANIPSEEAGAEYLTEPVGEGSETTPGEQDPVEATHQLFLPLLSNDATSMSNGSAAPLEATPTAAETTGITPTVMLTTTNAALIETRDGAAPVLQLYLPLVTAQ